MVIQSSDTELANNSNDHSLISTIFKPAQYYIDNPPPEMSWLVKDLIPARGLTIISGKPKHGKSTLVRQLAAAVSKGGKFLGRDVVQGPALYMVLDEPLGPAVKHLEKLDADFSALLVTTDKLPTVDIYVRVIEEAAQKRVKMLILDTLAKAVRIEDINDYQATIDALDPLAKAAHQHGIAVILVHHFNKKETTSNQDSLMGSSGIAGSVDQLIYVRKNRQTVFLSTDSRYAASIDDLALNLDTERMIFRESDNQEEMPTNERVERDILTFLNGRPSICSDDIVDAVSGKRETILRCLDNLSDSNRLTKTGLGRRGDPHVYSINVGPFYGAVDLDL
jgi:hypothetical protein